MKIMLTGGTGFIGSYVLCFLLADGHRVNALVRDFSKLNLKSHSGLKIFEGDLDKINILDKAVSGCDIVIHLAALVRTNADNPEEFTNTNYMGTENLLKASKRNDIKKFIYTSSLSAHSIITRPFIDEGCLVKPEKYFSDYAKTKGIAEDLVINYGKNGHSYVILYPQRMFGVGPLTDANGATKALQLYIKNKLPFLIDSGNQFASWSFVEDVARGIISAASRNIFNQKYILGGENETLANVYKLADKISSEKHLKINLKSNSALFLASVIERIAKLRKKSPMITKEWLGYILDSQKVSSEKAIHELNYKITPLETALEKTIDWLISL